MPKLFPARSRLGVGGIPASPGASPGAAAALGQSIQRLGGKALQIAEEHVARKNRDQTANALAEFRQTWTDNTSRIMTETELDALGTVPQFTEDFSAAKAEAIANAPSRETASYLNARLSEFGTRLAGKLTAFDAARAAEFGAQTVASNTEEARNRLLQDPGGFDEERGIIHDLIEGHRIPAGQKAKLQRGKDQDLAKSAVQGLFLQDWRQAQKSIASGKWDQYLDADVKARFLLQLEQAQNQERKIYLSDLDEYLAARKAGAIGRDPVFSPEAINAVLGPDGPDVAKRVESEERFADALAQLQWADPEQRRALIEAEIGETKGLVRGFKREQRQASEMLRAALTLEKRLQDDPAAYVQSAPLVAALAEELRRATPGEVQLTQRDYAAAVLGEQERLGVGPEGRRLLTESAAASMGVQFRRQPEGGQNAADFLFSMADLWGPNWPQVQRELTIGDHVSGPVTALLSMTGANQRVAAYTLVEAMNVGNRVLADALPLGHTSNDVDAEVADVLADFQVTMRDQLGGAEVYADFAMAARLLTLQYVFDGASLGESAERARGDLVGGYNFYETYRVPAAEDDRVRLGAGRALAEVGSFSLILPESLLGIEESAVRERYVAAVLDSGYWLTAPDERGLILYDETGSAVELEGGAPVSFTWQQLSDKASVNVEIGDVLPGFQGAP